MKSYSHSTIEAYRLACDGDQDLLRKYLAKREDIEFEPLLKTLRRLCKSLSLSKNSEKLLSDVENSIATIEAHQS